jgi:death on curing protein
VKPLFLSLDEILAIHRGPTRLQELQFAMGIAEAQFAGAYVYETLCEIAAAYLFHICRKGDQQTALACALVFLRLNKAEIEADADDLYDLVIGVAEGKVTKAAVAVFFEQHA